MQTTLTCSGLLCYCDRIIDRLRLTSKQHLFSQPYAVLHDYFSCVNSLSAFFVRDPENQENGTKRHFKVMPSIQSLRVSVLH